MRCILSAGRRQGRQDGAAWAVRGRVRASFRVCRGVDDAEAALDRRLGGLSGRGGRSTRPTHALKRSLNDSRRLEELTRLGQAGRF